jgi:ankyrin repeat protein
MDTDIYSDIKSSSIKENGQEIDSFYDNFEQGKLEYLQEIKQLKREHYTELDWNVITNNYDKVEEELEKGGTIFYSQNGCCAKICNGYFYRKDGKHPSKCKKKICNQTAIYHGLRLNARIYRSIYRSIVELMKIEPSLRPMNNYKDELNKLMNEIVDKFFSTPFEPPSRNQYCRGYKENYLNFKDVYDFLHNNGVIVRELLEKKYNKYKKYEVKINDIILDSLEEYIHTNIKEIYLFLLKDKEESLYVERDILRVVSRLICLFDMYFESCQIITLLFNQQAYELFQYSLVRINDEQILLKTLQTLYRDSDPFININYVNKNKHHSVLSTTVYAGEFILLIKHLLEKGAKIELCGRMHLLSVALKRGFYKSFEILLESLEINKNIIEDDDYLELQIQKVREIVNYEYENKTIFSQVLLDNKLDIDLRIKLLKKLRTYGADPNILVNDSEPLRIAINSNYAMEFMTVFFGEIEEHNENNLLFIPMDKIRPENITLAIKLKKTKVIKLLLENGADINGNMEHIPLHALLNNEFSNFKIGENKVLIDILKILLEYSPNVNIQNKNGLTPLHVACLMGNLDAVNILLNYNSNAFIKDITGQTSFIKAIESCNLEIIKLLCSFKNRDNYLINMTDNNGRIPAIHSLKTKKAYEIVKILNNFNMVDFSIKDNNNKNIMDYLFESHHKQRNEISKILITKIDILEFNNKHTNLLIDATTYDYYEIVEMMVNNLIKENKFRLKTAHITGLDNLYERKMKNLDTEIDCDENTFYFPLIWTYLAKEFGIKKTYGLELSLREDDESNFNMVLELILIMSGLTIMYLARYIDKKTVPIDNIDIDDYNSDYNSEYGSGHNSINKDIYGENNNNEYRVDIDRLARILEES